MIICHATFLFILILIREMIKDLENIEGDLSNNYQTLPVNFGENFAKNHFIIVNVYNRSCIFSYLCVRCRLYGYLFLRELYFTANFCNEIMEIGRKSSLY